MPCTRFHAAISARTEGEPLPEGITPQDLDAHLTACPDCRRWAKRLRSLREATDDILRRRQGDRSGSPRRTV